MRKFGLLLVSLLLCSCAPDSNPQQPALRDIQHTKELKTNWYLSYAALANKGTERTYQCISEMYSLAYKPVNSGPICEDSCELWEKLNKMVAEAPAFVDNPSQYAVDKGKVCREIEKRKARKAK